jgi:ketosteroid isomerase-like protein
MSDEDGIGSPLEWTRRMFESASAHDYEGMLGSFGPETVWDVSRWGLGVHTGVPAIRRFLELWVGSFDQWEITPLSIADLGNGVILVVAVQTARTSGSRQPFSLRQASVFVWEGEVVERVTHYMDFEAARNEAERVAALATLRPVGHHRA